MGELRNVLATEEKLAAKDDNITSVLRKAQFIIAKMRLALANGVIEQPALLDSDEARRALPIVARSIERASYPLSGGMVSEVHRCREALCGSSC